MYLPDNRKWMLKFWQIWGFNSKPIKMGRKSHKETSSPIYSQNLKIVPGPWNAHDYLLNKYTIEEFQISYHTRTRNSYPWKHVMYTEAFIYLGRGVCVVNSMPYTANSTAAWSDHFLLPWTDCLMICGVQYDSHWLPHGATGHLKCN